MAKSRATVFLMLISLCACSYVASFLSYPSLDRLDELSTTGNVIYEAVSKYNHIYVTEVEGGIRCLLFEKGGALQSVAKPDDPDYLELPYVRAMLVGLAFSEKVPTRILMVGLGGGTIPRFLHQHFPEATIHTVEIDPEVVKVAKRFFGFREDERMRVFVQDGRNFIEKCKDPYDLILLDAYSSENIPYHLATLEFLRAVRRAVKDNGVVVGNVWSRYSNPLYDSMVCTYQAAFEDLYIFDVQNSGNKIFVALKRRFTGSKKTLVERATRISLERRFPYGLGEIIDYGYSCATNKFFPGNVLRDKKKIKKEAGSGG